MDNKQPTRLKSISEFHRSCGLAPPQHPMVSVIDFSKIPRPENNGETSWVFDFYQISLKRGVDFKMKYGHQKYDFEHGAMFFVAPGQVFKIIHDIKESYKRSGWLLLIHPDFLWNTPLAKTIRKYEYFDYSINESLFLSQKEEKMVNGIIEYIQHEYSANIDKYSKQIIVSQIETLLGYSERFYNRQFITREKVNHQILISMEHLLNNYFENDDLISKGLPSVNDIAKQLNISPKYLSTLLKHLTGQSTQQHVHNKLIEKAKEKLSTTNLSISEIAYELGFEHTQSFSKLFKSKTNQSPLKFRSGFN